MHQELLLFLKMKRDYLFVYLLIEIESYVKNQFITFVSHEL